MGLSFEELNQMTLGEYLTFVDIYTDAETGSGDSGGTIREATQADINRFMG